LNDIGLKLKFDFCEERKTISTEFTPQKVHQGFKGIVHGGIIGLILDECMVNIAWKLGILAVSAEYTIRLARPAAINKKLIFFAKLTSERGKLLIIEGKCEDEAGKVIASSSSKCIKMQNDK